MCQTDENGPISVLIVDDHPMVLDGLMGYVQTAADMEVVGCTGDGEEALALVQERVPDVVLMDLVLQGSAIDGIEAIRRVGEVSPSTQVLAITAYDDDQHVLAGISAGAMGYVLKAASSGEILDAIRAVARRQPFIDARTYEKLRQMMARGLDGPPIADEGGPQLTPREREVLDLLVQGLTNQAIADELVVSIKTVKTHVSNILQKLHLSNRSEARLWALRNQAGD